MLGYYLSATDTHAGKTTCTRLLAAWLRAQGKRTLALKPLSSGDRQDGQQLLEGHDAAWGLDLDAINPFFYQSPLAPHVAARIEGFVVTTHELIAHVHALTERLKPDALLIEGIGGWEVPLADGSAQHRLVEALELRTLLVVANRLGALNHAVLSARAMEAQGHRPLGMLLNTMQESQDLACITNRSVLTELTGLPLIAELFYGQEVLEPERAELLL